MIRVALGNCLSDERPLQSGCDIPVDTSYVVAKLVSPCFAELGTMSRHKATMVAMQQPIEPPRDLEVETPQNLASGGGGGSDRIDRRT